ncbi:hypothetical protein [Desnuesiella massiliensis]|uniref:hypothetical protein n=1 Tax=Desnuesiella massiliensis TaxID=1650662 RepID=UPI000AD6738B|nr:hypothetical protein [Desnuesiella massiliensis]
MKKFVNFIICFIVLIAMIFIMMKYYKTYDIKIKDKNISWKVLYKGLKDARDFVYDEEGNCYIAFKDRIQSIDNSGKSNIMLKDKELDIASLAYSKEFLYFSSKTNVYSYNIKSGSKEIIIKDIPNYGDYNKSKVIIKDNSVYVTIGAVTNSGVVGPDNLWLEKYPFSYDITPKAITIKGKNFDKGTTGAFIPYKTKNVSGQIIPAHFPGNASVIRVNMETKNVELYAWGIRNIEGIDYNSEGKILASVGGMEDRGLRPIKGDSDYIFEIKLGLWYGWPDYSGGDPVDSPRFKGENELRVGFLLDKHPTTNPPAPLHQHNNLSSLASLSIDRNAILGEKDSIYFYDSKDNILYGLTKSDILKDKLEFNADARIQNIKFYKGGLAILDGKEGVLYSVENIKAIYAEGKNNKDIVIYCTLILFIIIIVILLIKSKNK